MHVEGSVFVRIRINCVTTLLAAGTAAIAIAAAPSASASPNEQPCSDMGGSTQCQRTGNVQIFTTPPMPATPNSTYGPFLGYHHGRT